MDALMACLGFKFMDTQVTQFGSWIYGPPGGQLRNLLISIVWLGVQTCGSPSGVVRASNLFVTRWDAQGPEHSKCFDGGRKKANGDARRRTNEDKWEETKSNDRNQGYFNGGGDARDEIIRGQAEERIEENDNEKRRKDDIMQKEDIKRWKKPESRIK